LEQLAIPQPPVKTRITVMQGQAHVSDEADVELSTVLGSCVASCLFDPVARLGGMNHFLLPEPPASRAGYGVDVHYGTYLMEVLINAMLARGGSKARMKAHLYGGANLHPGMKPIGSANADFARQFLHREGIPLVRADLGGVLARRVDFRPASGRVRCRQVEATAAPDNVPIPRAPSTAGDVELF
jgi:chemotaxis protein CheD